MDGAIEINQNGGAGAGDILLQGGLRNETYAQIGHGGARAQRCRGFQPRLRRHGGYGRLHHPAGRRRYRRLRPDRSRGWTIHGRHRRRRRQRGSRNWCQRPRRYRPGKLRPDRPRRRFRQFPGRRLRRLGRRPHHGRRRSAPVEPGGNRRRQPHFRPHRPRWLLGRQRQRRLFGRGHRAEHRRERHRPGGRRRQQQLRADRPRRRRQQRGRRPQRRGPRGGGRRRSLHGRV